MANIEIPKTWLQKVQYYLERDPSLNEKLAAGGKKAHPKGDSFHNLSWAVAEEISDKGGNPAACKKDQIIEVAHRLADVAIADVAKEPPKSTKQSVSEPVQEALSNANQDGDLPELFELPVRLSITVLLCSALELSRLDKGPDADVLRDRLNEVTKLYYKGLRGAKTKA